MLSICCFAFGLGFVLGYFGCLLAYKSKVEKIADDFKENKDG